MRLRPRMITPGFFSSPSLSPKVSVAARLTFIGLWTLADDHGNGPADPHAIKGMLWSRDDDVTPSTITEHLAELEASSHIAVYKVGERAYYTVPTFGQHQSSRFRRGRPDYPPPPSSQLRPGGTDLGPDSVRGGPSGSEADQVGPLERERERERERELERAFNDAWRNYPRKVNKRGAFKAFTARHSEGVELDLLVNCADHYAAACADADPKFVMHGSTFFGPNKRYEDFTDPPADPAEQYAPPPKWGLGD